MKSSVRMYRTPAKVPPPPASAHKSRPHSGSSSSNNNQQQQKDAVQVFCRIRPMQSDADLSCFRITSTNSVVMTPPENAVNFKVAKETQYIFKHIFDAKSKQRDCYEIVARPLVENLLKGRNGLLFTYGVTGSGKTYTMTGNAHDQGIMPRCLDALFETISDYQAKKFIFKPDRLNGFEILSEADAMLERQADMHQRFTKTKRKDSDPEIASRASTEASALRDCIDEDNMYAVFISYIEVYNNSVYDLLDDSLSTNINNNNHKKTLQSKIIREDSNHTMYVHGVVEIEVKTVQDAIEQFQIGQKRKRMGHTILNAESSRSHSVFTIRVVQAPTDSQGEHVLQDEQTIIVSQLSLVDLAGSERTNRTKNTGQRLREAGNINNSLMTLRTCLEILRENQASGLQKKVPYRDAKITHLFKSYFDGEGVVRMIVCINPRAEDYDESVQVMKFAEITQDVQIARPTPMKQMSSDIGLTPGRRRANRLFHIAVNNLNANGNTEAKKLDVDISLVYSLGPNFPQYTMDSQETAEIIAQLMSLLEQRIQKRALLIEDFNTRQSNFRCKLVEIEHENIALKTENSSLKAILTQERQRILSHENKIIIHESSIDELNKKLRKYEVEIRNLHTQLNQKQQLLNQKELEKEKQKKRLNSKFAVEQDKLAKQFGTKLEETKIELQNKMRNKEHKLKLLADIFNSNDENVENIQHHHQQQETECPNEEPVRMTASSEQQQQLNSGTRRGIAVANIRHRRSRSTGERWLEHRAPNPVPLGTILQPFYKNRKSITKLTDARDITNSKTSKYCLVSQAADTDGEVETRLYKGNVIPTTGGGAQVVFNDVELLKQTSPIKALSPPHTSSSSSSQYRKRISYPPTEHHSPCGGIILTSPPPRDTASKCSMGIEGHSTNKKVKY